VKGSFPGVLPVFKSLKQYIHQDGNLAIVADGFITRVCTYRERRKERMINRN